MTGPLLSQAFQCQFSSLCNISGLQGSGLAVGDELLPMQECGTSKLPATFPSAQPFYAISEQAAADDLADKIAFNLGLLPLQGAAPETVQLCWCPSSAKCQMSEYRAVAANLQLSCPPGTYELVGRSRTCQECPPGFYCPGGLDDALEQCPHGSTSPAESSSKQDCTCRRGFSWDSLLEVCLPCPAGSFKQLLGKHQCDGRCPAETTSLAGAISELQCFCASGKVDMDPSPAFSCTDLTASLVEMPRPAEATIFAFTGSIHVDPGRLPELQPLLEEYVESETGRASLSVVATSADVRYTLSSCEVEAVLEAHAKFLADPFEAWAIKLPGELALISVKSTAITNENISCPEAWNFPPGPVRSLADCRCSYGMEPSADLCKRCPVGTYKEMVGTSSCTSCPEAGGGLNLRTTLREGAVSAGECVCPAGYMSPDSTNSDCQPCEQGFFCFGGRKEPCPPLTTTVAQATSKVTDCICEPGYFASAGVCEPCAPGRFKPEAGNAESDCQACAAGTWSNASGATSNMACIHCIPGSTTEDEAATQEDLCIRPLPGEMLQCTAGLTCEVHITGHQLRDGHRMALTSSSGCTSANQPVPHVANEGMSQPASDQGQRYVWQGDMNAMDFAPPGGHYSLCWCANLTGLACASLESFQIQAGRLEVVGPFANHSFTCVRGQDCTGLPLQGVGFLTGQVSLRTSCGKSGSPLSLSPANENATGIVEQDASSSMVFVLSFGVSDRQLDHGVSLDASNDGYLLCWCTGKRPERSCAFDDSAVDAGRLRVEGPRTNQEVSCSVGQSCAPSGLESVGAVAGDRLMVLTACGTGSAVPGFPGGGIAEYVATRLHQCAFTQNLELVGADFLTQDADGFRFLGSSSEVLQSSAGIFRLCFCRPLHTSCDQPADFKASIGFITARGPFEQTAPCTVGSSCIIELSGMGLAENDSLVVTSSKCSESIQLADLRNLTLLQQPMRIYLENAALRSTLGEIPWEALPGVYQLCWCPQHLGCSLSSFRAAAGHLQVTCPQGFYSPSSRCRACGRGFYCPGGTAAARFPCMVGRTTLGVNTVMSTDCLCDRGYFEELGTCKLCPAGTYKSSAGSSECTHCPLNLTTFRPGAMSNSSCIEESSSSNEAPSNTSAVPAILFNLSISLAEGDLVHEECFFFFFFRVRRFHQSVSMPFCPVKIR